MDGILLINKEAGMTSHDVVNRLRKILHERRIGHSGTLDPQARGVLLVLIGKACKILPFLADTDKEYIAQLQLGKRTLSDDIWGEVLEEREIRPIEDLSALCVGFQGEIQQKPPLVSSIKVNGRKLYEYARNNESVEVPMRTVHVYEIEVLDARSLTFRVACSSGTYVRSLCRDMAEKSGNLGCMASLTRTKVGRFSLDQCYTLDQVEAGAYQLLEADALLTHIPIVDYEPIKDIYNGKSVHMALPQPQPLVRIQDDGRTIALYAHSHGDVYRCARGIW